MKKILISIFTLIFIISMVTIVNAAETGSITLTSSNTTVKAGDEFTVTISAQDTNGYNGIQYKDITITDQNGVETTSIKFEKVEALENNSKFDGVGDEAGVTAFTYSSTDNNTSVIPVCKLTFKVNSGITAGTYNINLGDMKVFSLNESDDTTEIGTKSVSIKAIVDTTTVGGDTDDEEKTPSNTPKEDDDGDDKSAGTVKPTNSGSKKTTLPQTGVELVSVIAIAVLSIFAVISYALYKKYKNI